MYCYHNHIIIIILEITMLRLAFVCQKKKYQKIDINNNIIKYYILQ